MSFSFATNLFAQAPPAPGHPTTYYLHGHIFTNDPKHPWAEGMAVRDGKIFCVGTLTQVLLDCGGAEGSDIVQLHGRLVLPGFNDAHVHLGAAGRDKTAVDLSGVTSLDEMLQRLEKARSKHKLGEWILGHGWDQTLWADQKLPTRLDLDRVVANNPVYLEQYSGHIAVVNSAALKHAEITPETPNPPGGEIERFEDGEPTGILKERAEELVTQRIPDPTELLRRAGIEAVLEELARYGVTSVQDFSDWDDFRIYNQLKQEKKLTVRITEWLPFNLPLDTLQNMRAEGGMTDPWLRTGLLNGFVDGALSTHTAALMAPYADDANTSGILIYTPDRLKAMTIERDRLGFQIAFHAIGDQANHLALDAFESLERVNAPRDRRDRLEHASVITPQDMERCASLHVIASMQPSFETDDLRWMEQRLGPERSKNAYAWNSLQKAGVRLAFGTDYDVASLDPLRGLYACVTRVGLNGAPADGWMPQEKLPLADCIAAYTSGSAYAEFMEGKKGDLKVGEFADFVVLSQDLTKIEPKDFLKTEVVLTVVGGRTVYQKGF